MQYKNIYVFSPKISVSVKLCVDLRAPGSLGASTSPEVDVSMAQGLKEEERKIQNISYYMRQEC